MAEKVDWNAFREDLRRLGPEKKLTPQQEDKAELQRQEKVRNRRLARLTMFEVLDELKKMEERQCLKNRLDG
jgi:hypothetical protein